MKALATRDVGERLERDRDRRAAPRRRGHNPPRRGRIRDGRRRGKYTAEGLDVGTEQTRPLEPASLLSRKAWRSRRRNLIRALGQQGADSLPELLAELLAGTTRRCRQALPRSTPQGRDPPCSRLAPRGQPSYTRNNRAPSSSDHRGRSGHRLLRYLERRRTRRAVPSAETPSQARERPCARGCWGPPSWRRDGQLDVGRRSGETSSEEAASGTQGCGRGRGLWGRRARRAAGGVVCEGQGDGASPGSRPESSPPPSKAIREPSSYALRVPLPSAAAGSADSRHTTANLSISSTISSHSLSPSTSDPTAHPTEASRKSPST